MKKAKKFLATTLTFAMLMSALAGVTVFSANAEENFDYSTTRSIDSVEEYVDFVKAVNSGSYKDNGDYQVTVDLDLSGYPAEDVVMKEMAGDMLIDFKGHTVSGIDREVSFGNHGEAGILADKAGNYCEILNVKIKDCRLSVSIVDGHYAIVGGVIGNTDRSHISGVEMENVTITLKGWGTVGLVYGERKWDDFRNDDLSVVLKNVLVDAPGATVGLIIGRQGDTDRNKETGEIDNKINVKKMNVSDTTIHASNDISKDSYVGTDDGNNAGVTVAQDAEINVDFIENAEGYVPLLKKSSGYIQFREDDGDSYSVRLVVSWDSDAIQNAKSVSLKLTFTGTETKVKTSSLSKAYLRVKAGDDLYKSREGDALLGFIVTGIPYSANVKSINATLILDGQETSLGAAVTGIPTRG